MSPFLARTVLGKSFLSQMVIIYDYLPLKWKCLVSFSSTLQYKANNWVLTFIISDSISSRELCLTCNSLWIKMLVRVGKRKRSLYTKYIQFIKLFYIWQILDGCQRHKGLKDPVLCQVQNKWARRLKKMHYKTCTGSHDLKRRIWFTPTSENCTHPGVCGLMLGVT